VSKKPILKPAAWKNTYFWIAGMLALLAVVGLIGGDSVIRDPGQRKESTLWIIYLGASVVMAINGFLSHRQTVQAYSEALENE
jgi:hypothetical protein